MALETMSSFPVASAPGSSRLMELARPFCPCAARILETPMPRWLATSVNFSIVPLSGG